jgi:imidazole glycerol-phosphate synthase subunit HisF
MKPIRLISRLDIKNLFLIKSINLEGLNKIGDPNEFAIDYYKKGIDEIILIDCVASLYGRNNLTNIIKKITKEIFVPVTVGGGIKTVTDVKEILKSGADKVAVNTAAVRRKNLIKEISEEIGKQSLIISIQAKKRQDKWEVFTESGKQSTGIDLVDWVSEVIGLGAGEILLTSIDKEGTQSGFDLKLIKAVSKICNIPLIISGGFGNLSHLDNLFIEEINIDGIAIAHALHYKKFEINEIRKKIEDLNNNK